MSGASGSLGSSGNSGTSCTLIFYHINNVFREAGLNLLAAAAQGSSLCHVEISLGESGGSNGEMTQVLRIFNDPVGVELTSRTGTSPSYTYLQIGCSHHQLARMLAFARGAVGKPFSNLAMARSLILPRKTDYRSYFCAELTAACLQAGGLLSANSNPGAATPASLHKLYSKQATSTGNPYALRMLTSKAAQSCGPRGAYSALSTASTPPTPSILSSLPASVRSLRPTTARANSPPRASLRIVSAAPSSGQFTLSLTSLTSGGRAHGR